MKKLLAFFSGMGFFFISAANNIQISNVTVSQPNISFTVQWDNSWNTTTNINPLYPNNWDGAWVFIKYQNPIDNLWKHATVSSTAGDHSISGGVLEIDPVTDGMGVFIRRTNPGFGNISATTVTLKMNALTGIGSFNFKVFATEMVYIPQSTFQLGDGQVSASYFTAQDITAAKQTGGIAAGAVYSGSPAIPPAFPMGYNAYYMMKYEISYEQWADFLNTLTYDQQANRTEIAPNAAVNTQAYNTSSTSYMGDNIIKMQSPGLNNTLPATFGCDLNGNNIYNEAADGQNVAMTSMNKADFFAYMDWCGLRPMTEMEFEKACRGTMPRVSGEYAWGSSEIVPHAKTGLANLGTSTEGWTGTVVNGQVMANGGPNASFGPARVGQFGTTSTGRASSGAGFYGNMDLSGNAWEICVMTDVAGAAFTGLNGNGQLTTAGDADVLNWPSGTTATGAISKGGSWFETSNYTFFTQVSHRNGAIGSGRNINTGGRGVRTAP